MPESASSSLAFALVGWLFSPLLGVTTINSREPYRWVLFDADGTLFDYNQAEKAALAQVFELNQVPFQPGFLSAYRRINQQLWCDLENKLVTPEALKLKRFELLLAELAVDRPASAFSELYLQCLAGCSELMPGAAEVLQALQPQCRFAIVTNGLKAVQRSRVERSALRHIISELVISEEIGCAKPSREFFDITFARLGHPPKSEVLLVGDGWSSDIAGAANYGIDACWFNPSGQARPASPDVQFEIASLSELESIVLSGSPPPAARSVNP